MYLCCKAPPGGNCATREIQFYILTSHSDTYSHAKESLFFVQRTERQQMKVEKEEKRERDLFIFWFVFSEVISTRSTA